MQVDSRLFLSRPRWHCGIRLVICSSLLQQRLCGRDGDAVADIVDYGDCGDGGGGQCGSLLCQRGLSMVTEGNWSGGIGELLSTGGVGLGGGSKCMGFISYTCPFCNSK